MRAFYLLLPYLWSKEKNIRTRVIFSIICLIIAKLISLAVPLTYKYTIDRLANHSTEFIFLWGLLTYGSARILSVIFTELRDIIFARVGQRAARMVTVQVFQHLHRLSLRFHINRKTG